MNSFRTFIAIELTSEVRARVAQHIDRLRHELADMRVSWSREDSLHLTLKFLGNVPVADIPKVSDAVASATKSLSPFEITFSNCGTFPPHGRPSVLWIGITSEPAAVAGEPILGNQDSRLHRLQSAIEEELAETGFARESRPFHPHLTIGRLRQSQGARQLAELHLSLGFAPIACAVSEVVVFRSELLKQGSKHTPISRHKLP